MADEATGGAGGTENKMTPFGIVTAVLAAGLTLYFMSAYAGPYRWAAELQMATIGSYSQKLTFLLAFLGLWAAVGLVALPFRRLLTRDPASTPPRANPRSAAGGPVLPPVPGATPPLPGTAPPVPAATRPAPIEMPPAKRPAGRLADLGLALLLMGGIFAFLGGRDYLRASAGGTIADATIAQFQAGQPPASTWVRVTGVPLVDAAVGYGSSRSSPDLYVPLASGGGDADGPPPPGGVRLFAKFRSKATPTSRVEGLVEKNGLPGPVRTSTEEAGLLPAGTDHWLIEAGKDPARTKSIGQTMGLAGAGMFVVGLLLNVNRFRRR